jgi:hypothetical protein
MLTEQTKTKQEPCKHPPDRLYAWNVNDAKGKDTMVVCLKCETVLRGGYDAD